MARIQPPRVFDSKMELVARKHFRAAGRSFRPGDPFPWKQMALSERRVQLMYLGGHVMEADESPLAAAPEPTPAPEPAASEEETFDFDAPAEDDLESKTVVELRAIADAEGVEKARLKADLIANIRAGRG